MYRAVKYYHWSYHSNGNQVREWRVDFGIDWTEYDLWKMLKTWQTENCEGEWEKDYRISSAGYAAFSKLEDAMLCYLKFA